MAVIPRPTQNQAFIAGHTGQNVALAHLLSKLIEHNFPVGRYNVQQAKRVHVEQWVKYLSHVLRMVGRESVPNLIQAHDLETKVAILRKRAELQKVTLPADVALYIAQNVRSNASALEGALIRLLAYSSLTGTEITLAYTQQVLKNFIDLQARKVTVDPLQKMPPEQFGTREAKIRRQDWTAADRGLIFSLLKTRDGRKTSRARQELEVNMRESERERLARRDGYERELERRAKKRKQG